MAISTNAHHFGRSNLLCKLQEIFIIKDILTKGHISKNIHCIMHLTATEQHFKCIQNAATLQGVLSISSVDIELVVHALPYVEVIGVKSGLYPRVYPWSFTAFFCTDTLTVCIFSLA